MKIKEVMQKGREVLINSGIDPKEARLLLSFILKIRSEDLIKYESCTESQYEEFMNIINERAKGRPFAYIVGHKEFMKLDFIVNEDVLIPREDTEILVQKVIEMTKNTSNIEKITQINKQDNKGNIVKILDMCTGSGCIAISLAKYIKNASVVAVDISERALKVANENAKNNNVKVEFLKSNLFENINDKFDIIVSNPPYIKSNIIDTLQKEVKSEPILALDGGETGLYFYDSIIKEAPKYLNKNGILAFEIGFDQADDVQNLLKTRFENIKVFKDYGENNRVVIGTLKI